MNYIVYCITNHINNKTYIGCHKTENIHDDYMGSGKLIKLAINKYGIENFSKKILFCFDNAEEMFEKEKECILEDAPEYNLHEGGRGGFDYVNSLLTIDDRRVLRQKANDILRQKYGEEYKTVLGNRGSAARKIKNPDYMREMKIKSREKEINVGHPFLGKNHTEESKRKIGAANSRMIGDKNSQYGTCWIKNIGLNESKKIRKDQLDHWIANGWISGRISKVK